MTKHKAFWCSVWVFIKDILPTVIHAYKVARLAYKEKVKLIDEQKKSTQ